MKNNIPENKQRKYRDQCTRSHTNSEVVFNENQNNAIHNYKLNIKPIKINSNVDLGLSENLNQFAKFKLNEVIPIKIDKEQRYETYQFLEKSQVDEPQRTYYTQDKNNDM
ncbi:hypothetical protein APICC_09391 [Apis cerana cerana]|uniref:Uncharacterized protein n=1 Tax=Apis cerana cerana TaxID=94128 RepID=A0A2A3EFI5_APICC|nr:hypothetical protein APICC_09391 [Apis cerana cerana]